MNNCEREKKSKIVILRTFYIIWIFWYISNDLYHDISSGMGDEEGDEPITNKEYPGGRVGLGARVIKVRLLFQPWCWWGGVSDQERISGWIVRSSQIVINSTLTFTPQKSPRNVFPGCIWYLQIQQKIQIWHVQQWGLWLILSKCQIFGGTFSQLQTRSDFDLSWPRGLIVTMLSLILMISSSCRCRKKMQWL